MVFRWGQSWVQVWDFEKVFLIVGKDFCKLYVQSGEKFQCTDNLGRFSCIPNDKTTKIFIEIEDLCVC